MCEFRSCSVNEPSDGAGEYAPNRGVRPAGITDVGGKKDGLWGRDELLGSELNSEERRGWAQGSDGKCDDAVN
jgi:hypothetical protein